MEKRLYSQLWLWVFLTLLTPLILKGETTFNLSNPNHFSYTFDACTGAIHFKILVADIDNCDDALEDISLKTANDAGVNTEFFRIRFRDGSFPGRAQGINTIDSYNHDVTGDGWNGNIIRNIVRTNAGDLYYIEFDWYSPTQSQLELGTINLSVNFSWAVDWDDPIGCDRAVTNNSGNPTISVSSAAPSQVTGLTAVENCGSVSLSWTAVSASCASNLISYAVYRNGNLVGTTSGTTYNDIVASGSYSYTVKARKNFITSLSAGVYKYVLSAASNSASGTPKFVPEAPFSVVANDDVCANNLLVNWSFTPQYNPIRFRLERSTTNSPFNPTYSTTVSISARQFNDQNIVRGQQYFYRLFAVNSCGDSPVSDVDAGFAPAIPAAASNIVATPNAVTGVVSVTWSDNSNNEAGFIVERSFFGGGGLTTFNVGTGVTNYTDNTVTSCLNYVYNVKSQNDCAASGIPNTGAAASAYLPTDITDVFNTTNNVLTGSKGYFNNRVQLTWSANKANVLDGFFLYRRQYGTSVAFSQIASVNNTETSFDDITTDAGVIYEYQIVGRKNCAGTTVLSNLSTDIGFRSPTGVISGQITYTGGIAVEGVRVLAQSTSNPLSSSLAFNGTSSYLTVPHKANLMNGSALTIESWVRPSALTGNTLILKKGNGTSGYGLETNGSDIVFYIYSGGVKRSVTKSGILSVNNYTHLAGTFDGSMLRLYANGQPADSLAFAGSVDTNTDAVLIGGTPTGNYFAGNIDETKIWNIARSGARITMDFNRLLVGTEIGLVAYWTFDENVSILSQFFDKSKTGTLYNENHGAFAGGVAWSNVVPSSSQLGYAGVTDSTGTYLISGIKYLGNGENFQIVPSLGVHQFSPASRILFVGDGSNSLNNIDFLDQSSFRVLGRALYKGYTCPVEGAKILLDGRPITLASGLLAETDVNGEFDVQIPIGLHAITLFKDGHTFSEGRFPATGFHDFQEPILSHITFKDSTFIKVVGKVVGGDIEASKVPGMGLARNNIGRAELTFNATNNCTDTTFQTDPVTGEYTILLPPVRYEVPSVRVMSNLSLNLSPTVQIVDLRPRKNPIWVYDTVRVDTTIVSIDSAWYQHEHNYIYYEVPKVAVFGVDGTTPLRGENTYNVAGTQVDLTTSSFPAFKQNKYYDVRIRATETYINNDSGTPVSNSIPVQQGVFVIDNKLSNTPLRNINLVKANNGVATYGFNAGVPNIAVNTVIPKYSFTETFNITLRTANNTVQWEPYTTNTAPEAGADKYFRGYILGDKPKGTDFVSTGPEMVELVLRDPPGNASSASWERGSSISRSTSFSYTNELAAEAVGTIHAGVKAGDGRLTGVDIETNFSLGVSGSTAWTGEGENVETLTTLETISTPADPLVVGDQGDVYFGRSRQIIFGATDKIYVVHDSFCQMFSGDITCVGDPLPGGYRYGRVTNFAMQNGLTQTKFYYTRFHIENTVIPNLLQLRSALLRNASKYQSYVASGHPLYGANNDDYNWVNQGATPSLKWKELNKPSIADITNPAKRYQHDWNGPSYRFTPNYSNPPACPSGFTGVCTLAARQELAHNATVDSVRWINQQIKLWKEAIAKNEADKIRAFTGSPDFEQREIIAFSGLVNVGRTYISDSTITDSKSFEFNVGAMFNTTFGTTATIFGAAVGLTADLTLSYNHNEVRSSGTTTQRTTTFNYQFADTDLGDAFSMAVYKPKKNQHGDIFKLLAGRTKCPYENGEVMRYVNADVQASLDTLQASTYNNPGYQLSPRTLQRERPQIRITPSVLYNVPADEAAVFQVELRNLSESSESMGYDVLVDLASNPGSAIIDGVEGSYTVPFGTLMRAMSINKGPSAYDYDSIAIIIKSPCQWDTDDGEDIADTAYVTVHYLPTCTTPTILSPLNNWVLNNSFNDTLPIVIGGYNYNFDGLANIKFQYKDASFPLWTDVETFHYDTTGLNNPDAKLIPRGRPYITYPFDMKQIADGAYQIRAISTCNIPSAPDAEKEGELADGLCDRVNPHPFGTPSPGDGILSPNDDISIQFNETINDGILNFTNVDIRGVVNGTDVANSTALNFDGNGDYAELAPGLSLANRNFTFECWHKRDALGAQTIFSQGIDAAQTLMVGFDAADKFFLGIGTSSVAADNAQTDVASWHHYSVVFDNVTKNVELFIDGTLVNLATQNLPKTYTGAGKSYFGKSSTGTPRWLNGSMHEVRLWNKKRSLAQILASKSVRLSGREEGITANWLMDEAIGGFAADRVRSRNAQIFNATWKVYPSGSAADFNGSSRVDIPSNTVAITKEMDFTLEMWVRGTLNGNTQTLWSNGRADGTDANPGLKWRLDADPTGAIKLYNNGLVFDAIATNVLDDNWHHIAFVMRRSSSISAYLDGDLVTTTPAAAWGEFGGAKMWVGDRGFFTGTVEGHDRGFTGKIDEFRFWNSSRLQAQIARDRVNRLNGNETGLVSYLPFEQYQLNMGVPVLTPGFFDAVTPTRVVTNNGASLTSQAPTIKLPRPVQTIPYQRSVNNDQMILTPTVDPALIENVTLDITVRGVEDMNGNVMQSPKTWIAYMDKNQVKWQDQELSFTKEINTQLTFNAVIVNTGGALKQYTIQNLPSWLSVSSPSGVISPASSQTVTFTVDQGLNIGDYEQDVQLLTDFGYAEVLVVKMKVFAPAPSTWTVNPSAFQSSMSMIGALQVDNVLSSNTEDRLAAFVNGQCRGVGRLQYYPQYDRYLVFLDVYSNVSSGERLTFQMWDASKGQIYADVQPHIDFFADSLVGQILSPQIFNATSKVIVTRTLNNGWNWLSFPAMPTDSVNIANLFQTLTFNNNDEFKSSTLFSRYAPATGWVGSLSRVDVEPSYRLKASRGGVLTYEARELDPSTKPISLAAGWNWMGFVSLRNQAVGDALGNHNPTAGDLIKGQTQFAVYDPILGWIGSLEYLRPSEGYMMRSAAAGTFTFPLAGSSNRNPSDAEIVDARWPYNPGDWNTNASMVAELDYCGNAVPEGAYYIGVFQGNQCRGLAEPMLFSNRQRSLAFVTLYGNPNDSLELRLLDRVSGAETPISSRISYIPNGQLGDLTTPHTLQLPSGFACQGISGVEDVENSLIGARPVPFADDLTVTWPEELAPASEEVTIRLTDMQGKLITEVRANGGTKFLGQLSNLPNGMYILTVQGDTQTAQLKVVKARP